MAFFNKKRVYLDHAAATPVRKEVLAAMESFWRDEFGNPSSIHEEGYKAKQAVEAAREELARSLRVRQEDIIFTSGGTESNNLALKGTVRALKQSEHEVEIISTATEHPSIIKALEELEEEGVRVLYAPISEDGLVILNEFKNLLSPKTRLITIAYANSETGVVQDLSRLGRAIKEYEKENETKIIFHTDAAQGPLWLPCALDALFVDMMTLDAGKCGGPKGVGVLVKRPRAELKAVYGGGTQERSMRPGTEPVALIVGASKAIVLAQKEMEENAKTVSKMRDWWIKKLLKLPNVVINGSLDRRIANNVNISIPGFDTEFAVVSLDAKGVAASTKSACSGAGGGLSEVVMNMTGNEARAAATIRFTFSPTTAYSELKRATKALQEHLEKMQNLRTDPS